MSKMKKKIDIAQINIFEVLKNLNTQQRTFQEDIPGRLNIDLQIRELITQSLKKTRLSRYEVAGKMSELLAKEITKAQIDAWSAESKEGHRFPLAYLPAFCEATGDSTLIKFIAEKCGGFYIENEEAIYTELGKIEQAKKELTEKEKFLKTMLVRLRGQK